MASLDCETFFLTEVLLRRPQSGPLGSGQRQHPKRHQQARPSGVQH